MPVLLFRGGPAHAVLTRPARLEGGAAYDGLAHGAPHARAQAAPRCKCPLLPAAVHTAFSHLLLHILFAGQLEINLVGSM